jgi:isoamyl acetate esterase
MVFFGANDASLPDCGNGQHVPLDEFEANITRICQDPIVQAHAPKIILVTPPPIEEYRMEITDREKGRPKTRTADHTKLYADATRKVGQFLGVAVLDLWTRFIHEAGWIQGQPLPGRQDQEPNAVLRELLHDGQLSRCPSYLVEAS